MLQNKQSLQNSKNLLAFSAGVDSTALLFLLLENSIQFDIAIVDYGLREQSQEELTYAQTLAQRYGFTCHAFKAPKIEKNFEAKARELRYEFFESLIAKHGYNNLLTAHHLGDRLEWMLMQFCKGAGCYELSGMKASSDRSGYKLIRPLLHLEKRELLEYLQKNNIHYFIDSSNSDEKYKRNEFRHKYAMPLLKEHLQGIKKSFEYLDRDVEDLVENIEVRSLNKLAYFKSSQSKRSNTIAIDNYLKTQGHLITANEKELLNANKSLVLGRKYVVFQSDTYSFITPYIKVTKLSKEFKEKMRKLKIDPKLRGYLSTDAAAVSLVSELLW